MFTPEDILYEDNHLLVVNKHCGDLVQPDPSGGSALEDQIKAFIKRRDAKPGEVFLGVVHRIDRPVSGAVLFAKTSKALTRLNEMIREGRIRKIYWALTEQAPDPLSGELCHYILRDGRANRSRACDAPKADAKQARLRYATLGAGTHYTLVEVELLTGRHHQIRAQLSKIGCPIRGDLKYGARRSLPGGGISLHSRSVEFEHPVRHEPVAVTAPVPADLRRRTGGDEPRCEAGRRPGAGREPVHPAGLDAQGQPPVLYQGGARGGFVPDVRTFRGTCR